MAKNYGGIGRWPYWIQDSKAKLFPYTDHSVFSNLSSKSN